MSLETTYDQEADAAYATLVRGAVDHTSEIAPGILGDYDSSGRLLGIEIMSVSRRVGAGDRASYLQGLVEGLLSGSRQAAE